MDPSDLEPAPGNLPAPPPASLGARLLARLGHGVPQAGSYWLTRFVFLRLLGFVYFLAFLSLAHQVLPLIGQDGLLPAASFLTRARDHFGSTGKAFAQFPSLFWLGASDALLQALAWVGVGLSLVVVSGFANSILMAAIWLLYMSFVHIGQIWYGFGWEIQLLETGFLAIFLCPLIDPRPFPRTAPPPQVFWLLRWLIFRIMLGAGLIKLRGDECWRDLTCMYYHYETQPIPNPLSRWMHFLPPPIHKLECLWNHFTELVVPWFCFWPPRVRRVAGLLMILFQVLLILSGNLSFLNYLTIAPCLACLDDGFWRRVLPRRLVALADRAAAEARPSRVQTVVAWMLVAFVAWLSIDPVENLLSPRQQMNRSFHHLPIDLEIVNTYGAFGSVGRERYEIILEGTDDEAPNEEAHWKAYEFKAKPGDPERRPPVTAPYHYRIDWEIWFAAMSTPDEHPWMLHLVWKLLHNDGGALSLLANRPFPDRPPRWIRAELYVYKFTQPGSGDSAYWTRQWVRPWLPPLSVDDAELRDFLRAYGWLREPGAGGGS